jgi:hypothetical protein
MKKRLIITESQLERLKTMLNENKTRNLIVKQLKGALDSNYEPIEKYVRKGGEYSPSVMVKVKVDDEEITLKDLLEYLDFKFKFKGENNEFLKQVISDWMFGKIDSDFNLSKNIGIK